MRNAKLGTKLIGAFIMISLIGVIIGLLGIVGMKSVQRSFSDLTDHYMMASLELSQANTAFEQANGDIKDLVVETEALGIGHLAENLEKSRKIMDDKLTAYEKALVSKEGRTRLAKLKEKLAQYTPIANETAELGKTMKKEEASQMLYGQLAPVVTELRDMFSAMMSRSNAQVQEELADNNAAVNRIAVIMFISTVVGLILSFGLALLLTRSITRPINNVAAGLSEGAEQVASASAQVASASQNLAQGNSNQASSLEETSSSLEELSSMTKRTADNAAQAKAMMAEARDIVARVSRHMEDMANAIKDITKSSEETGKIIKTIDEIAFQTNLLALNAAVEAARAGEAGAGFAVVANEVRNLAMRAAEAAKNTSNLIENTIQSVHNGNNLTNSTLTAFKENIAISDRVGVLIDEIATASQEQAHGIGEINTAVASMDKVTQESAANAEESASASEEMNAQAEQMKVFVQELIAVLEGDRQTNINANETFRKPLGQEMKESVSLSMSGVNPRRRLLPTPGKPASNKIIKPEDIIPLEEEKFRDF